MIDIFSKKIEEKNKIISEQKRTIDRITEGYLNIFIQKYIQELNYSKLTTKWVGVMTQIAKNTIN
jgi:hypothetical protein